MSPPDERGTGPKAGPQDNGHHAASSSPDHTTTDQGHGQATLDAYLDAIASRGRATSLATAESNDAEWVERVHDWIYDLAPGELVTADDVRSRSGASNAVGSVFRTASRRGVLVAVGLQESNVVTRHKGLQRVWRRT